MSPLQPRQWLSSPCVVPGPETYPSCWRTKLYSLFRTGVLGRLFDGYHRPLAASFLLEVSFVRDQVS